jgi:hypothetical protein
MNKLMLAAALLIGFLPPMIAQGTWTQIDYPGATTTKVRGIDA